MSVTSPTVVLVHGAFAESSSWNGVIERLAARGLTSIALANPLRSATGDAAYVSACLDALEGPFVLVGHSYGGTVISGAASGRDDVAALVFVSAFAPGEGESAAELSSRFPGSTLSETLLATPLPDGDTDLRIDAGRYHGQFAGDHPAEAAAVLAVTQRPITERALTEGAAGAAWRSIPSSFIFGDADKNIPLEALRFMAERAEGRTIREIAGGSHALAGSHPEAVAEVIVEAASSADVAAA